MNSLLMNEDESFLSFVFIFRIKLWKNLEESPHESSVQFLSGRGLTLMIDIYYSTLVQLADTNATVSHYPPSIFHPLKETERSKVTAAAFSQRCTYETKQKPGNILFNFYFLTLMLSQKSYST